MTFTTVKSMILAYRNLMIIVKHLTEALIGKVCEFEDLLDFGDDEMLNPMLKVSSTLIFFSAEK